MNKIKTSKSASFVFRKYKRPTNNKYDVIVEDTDGGEIRGVIYWKPFKDIYVFAPDDNSVFPSESLAELADYIEYLAGDEE